MLQRSGYHPKEEQIVTRVSFDALEGRFQRLARTTPFRIRIDNCCPPRLRLRSFANHP
jgi:hypothetical protein